MSPGKTAARSPSVLFVGNFLSGERTTRSYCEDLSERLRERGWTTITVSERVQPFRRVIDMCTTIWARRHDYDVGYVDVYSGRAFLWAEASSWLLRRLKKPHVLALRGGGLPDLARRRSGRVRRLLRSADVVTCPSPYTLEAMRAYRDDLVLLPNAVPIERHPPRRIERPRPRLVWLRAFHRFYNPLMAVEVAARLVGDFPDLSLTMVGPITEPDQYDAVLRAAAEARIAERVTVPGGVPKMAVPRWLEAGDIFINTADVDNTPVSVLEAMAAGLCVVSTNVGGIPYLLRHEETALLVPPGDAAAMADAIRRLMGDAALAARLSARGRDRAESFAWSRLLPEWEAAFASLASSTAPARHE